MKTILLAILFLATQQSLSAQAEIPPGFLWQVEINGSEFTLAGSIHAGKKEHYPVPKGYLKEYKKSDFIIFELKDDFESIKEQIFAYAEKDKLEESQYLDNYLSEENKKTLAALFRGEEETLQRHYAYEGWLLNMSIMGMSPRLIGYEPKIAVDKYFHDLAIKDKKTIYGLDDIETQIGIFELELPNEVQLKVLENGLKSINMKAKSEQPLFDAYYSQDRDVFEKAFLTPMNFENPQVKAMYDRIFVARNKAWVQKLIELANKEKGQYFMLVGCGHYFGPENVLELLKKEGFKPKEYKK
ncbi:MAG: TraB/GumN family protein [Bacteroidales bacterium]